MATALSKMMKKAAFPLISLANRRTPHRNYASAIFSNPLKTSTHSTHHHFSALAETEKRFSADDALLGVIQSEIDFCEGKFHEFREVPREFPFKIVDNAGEESIILTRVYEDEEIKVKVHGPHHSNESSDDEEDENDPKYVYLNVSVSKKSGRTLEFNIAAYADRIEISGSLKIKNPNASHDYPCFEEPHFLRLDEALQKAFHTYVELRGFAPSIGNFLCEYMVQRKPKKHTARLKYLKNFIATTSTSNSTTNISRQVSRATLVQPHHHHCALANKKSNSDDTLLSVLESEIDCAEEKFHEFAEAPKDLPFKIEDNVGERKIIMLTREYQGEEIKVKVRDESYYPPQYSYSLIGSVSNQSGLNLKFDVTAHSEDGINIKSLVVKNPNASERITPFEPITPFSDLDEKLQKAFRAYLEDRGIIEPSIGKFIHDCMVKRKHKIYVAWLKNFKNFIAD
ncbi:hypothetical protein MKW92_046909 [Papaver armeniacum]|nr:hypothetical protein MKW92_046909 [Papaver armeniacum]